MRPESHIVDVRARTPADDDYVRTLLTDSWGSTVVAAHGMAMDAAALPGLVAVLGGSPAGLITYREDVDSWELVTVDAAIPGRGVGTALLGAAADAARSAGKRRLWLITTNDNTTALRFYQRRGVDLVAVHRDAVTRARADLKPGIPLEVDGIPVRHEVELELVLT